MKIHIKAFILGVAVSVFAAVAFASSGIRYVVFNGVKVIHDGRILNLGGKRLISLAKDGERYASNYMPARAVFEAMGYDVDWDGANGAVIVTGEPGASEFESLYWRPADEEEPVPQTDTETLTAFGKLSNKKISIPIGLMGNEGKNYKLITDIMAAEMNLDTGMASIIAIAKKTTVEDAKSEKAMCDILYTVLSTSVTSGCKKVLSTIDKPSNVSTPMYKNAYANFEKYVYAMEEMLKSFRNANYESGLIEFNNAADIYLSML